MKLLQNRAPASRTDRYATQLLHDEPGVRIVSFHLAGGQEVPPHSSTSTVVVHVLEGTGVFRGGGIEERLSAGQGVVYAPGEVHSMVADDGPLRFLATITPGSP